MVYLFQTVANFRDFGTSAGKRMKLCPNIAFRSATLDHASEEDLHKLANELNVNTIIDLRSELEANLARAGKTFSTFPVAAAMKMKPKDLLPGSSAGSIKEKTEDHGNGKRTVMINFAGERFRKYAVWKPASFRLKLKIIINYLSKNGKQKAAKLVGEEILSKKGLDGLYRDFVDYCGYEMNQALQIIADPSSYPLLIHCTQGKDRTGLVTALALAAAGVNYHDIVEDYARSREGLEVVKPEMVAEMAKDGLDPSFADAPPEVMINTFHYIQKKYGSVERYLDIIGFTERSRMTLRELIRQASNPEQNQAVEEALTQHVDKAPQQNADARAVLTTPAEVDILHNLPLEQQEKEQQTQQEQQQSQQQTLQQPLQQPLQQQPLQQQTQQQPLQQQTQQQPLQQQTQQQTLQQQQPEQQQQTQPEQAQPTHKQEILEQAQQKKLPPHFLSQEQRDKIDLLHKVDQPPQEVAPTSTGSAAV